MPNLMFNDAVMGDTDNVSAINIIFNNDMTGSLTFVDQMGSTITFTISASDYAKLNVPHGADNIQLTLQVTG